MAFLVRFGRQYIRSDASVEFYQVTNPAWIQELKAAMENFAGVTKVTIATESPDASTFITITHVYFADLATQADADAVFALMADASSAVSAVKRPLDEYNAANGIHLNKIMQNLVPTDFPQYCA